MSANYFCAATLAVMSLISRTRTEAILSGAFSGSETETPVSVCFTFNFLWSASKQAFFTWVCKPARFNCPSFGQLKIWMWIFPGLVRMPQNDLPGLVVQRQSHAEMNFALPFLSFSVALNEPASAPKGVGPVP